MRACESKLKGSRISLWLKQTQITSILDRWLVNWHMTLFLWCRQNIIWVSSILTYIRGITLWAYNESSRCEARFVLYLRNCTCFVSQWLYLFCISVTVPVLYLSDCTCFVSQWLYLFCISVTVLVLYLSDCTCFVHTDGLQVVFIMLIEKSFHNLVFKVFCDGLTLESLSLS